MMIKSVDKISCVDSKHPTVKEKVEVMKKVKLQRLQQTNLFVRLKANQVK